MSSFKNRLNINGDRFIFFKMSLNSTPNRIEDNEIEMLIIAIISTLKGSSKNVVGVFDLAQTSLDTDITRETFDKLLQNMVESNAVKLQTIGDRECLSLPKQEAKDADAINNRTKSDLEVFQLQLGKFKSSLYEQFTSFKQPFTTEVSQFKSDFLCKKSARNDENTTEKLLHQMEITFLHEEIKIKNTIITLLLGYLCFPAPGPGPRAQFVFDGPGLKFVFHGPSLQSVFTNPGPQFVFVCSSFYS